MQRYPFYLSGYATSSFQSSRITITSNLRFNEIKRRCHHFPILVLSSIDSTILTHTVRPRNLSISEIESIDSTFCVFLDFVVQISTFSVEILKETNYLQTRLSRLKEQSWIPKKLLISLALAISLKTLKSAHVKRVAKSKRWQVYVVKCRVHVAVVT